MSRCRLTSLGVGATILALASVLAIGFPRTAPGVPEVAAAAGKSLKQCKKTCRSMARSCKRQVAEELQAARKACAGTRAEKRQCRRAAARRATQARGRCASGLAGCKVCCARSGTPCFDGVGPGIAGRVLDVAGNPIAGVTVRGPAGEATTDSDGRFQLAAQVGDGQIVTLSREGFVSSARIVSVPPDTVAWLPVTMMPLAPPVPLDATAGGTVVGARGSSLTAPAAAFVDAEGTPIAGEVEVSLTPYDPAIPQEALAYPGELRGLTLDGRTLPLETFGVMDVTVRQGGRVLQVGEGKTLALRLPAPSAGAKPETVQMWRYDTARALWVQLAGDGIYDASSNSFAASVGPGIPLDLPLNCDNPLRPTCIYGLVTDQADVPVRGARVTAQSADPGDVVGVYSETTTSLYGSYCMTVEMESQVLLTVTTRDGVVTQRRITAGSTLSTEYPADCSTGRCKQVRTIVTGTPDPGESSADCNVTVMDNPFAATCLRLLGELYACFAPEGPCTSRIDPGLGGLFSMEITFANGARMTSGESLFDLFATRYYGPGGRYCGKMSSFGDDITIELASGASTRYAMATTADGGVEVTCESGATYRLSGAQLDALAGCSGGTGDERGTRCEPAPGSFLAPCLFGSNCDTGLDCCGSPVQPRAPVPPERHVRAGVRDQRRVRQVRPRLDLLLERPVRPVPAGVRVPVTVLRG